MSEFRIRPIDNYIHEADWQKLYVLTEHWKSDLEFYLHDLQFLAHVIDKYFIWMTNEDDIHHVQKVKSILAKSTRNCEQLKNRTAKHLSHLADLIDDPFKYDSHVFRNEHEQLENDIASFVKLFRKNRKDVYRITEYVLDSEKLSNLMK